MKRDIRVACQTMENRAAVERVVRIVGAVGYGTGEKRCRLAIRARVIQTVGPADAGVIDKLFGKSGACRQCGCEIGCSALIVLLLIFGICKVIETERTVVARRVIPDERLVALLCLAETAQREKSVTEP